jgi:hypothetical protein
VAAYDSCFLALVSNTRCSIGRKAKTFLADRSNKKISDKKSFKMFSSDPERFPSGIKALADYVTPFNLINFCKN